ncbi:MAG: hypothetical protein KDD44_05930, partial [Bdellovibrionales bacterium]|nr:hypothetical protein [Bdellovibrionales bacterium]
LEGSGVGGSRVITLQLGSGCSAAAVRDGRPIDCTMGFSPLEGLMMATRSGDIDPGLLLWLLEKQGYSAKTLDDLLNRKSGLLGYSGESGDMRVLLESTWDVSRAGVQLYCFRVQKCIGGFVAALGGVDAVVFGGGVGEHAAVVREQICSPLVNFGISLDDKRNREPGPGRLALISNEASKAAVYVASVDESLELVEAVRELTKNGDPDERSFR